MAKQKTHVWKPDKSIHGVWHCKNCNVIKVKPVAKKAIIYRPGGLVDSSPTRNNCFKLSKD